MEDEQAPLPGPDFKDGVPSQNITEGMTLLGHFDGEPIFLTRCNGEIVTASAKCPHYGGPLNEGLIVGDTIRCPWHHAEFSLCSGKVMRPPSLHDIQMWEVVEWDGKAKVVGKVAKPDDGRQTNLSRQANLSKQTNLPSPSNHAGKSPKSVIIMGAGAAGAVAANTLRNKGYNGTITMIESGLLRLTIAPTSRRIISPATHLRSGFHSIPTRFIPISASTFCSIRKSLRLTRWHMPLHLATEPRAPLELF